MVMGDSVFVKVEAAQPGSWDEAREVGAHPPPQPHRLSAHARDAPPGGQCGRGSSSMPGPGTGPHGFPLEGRA